MDLYWQKTLKLLSSVVFNLAVQLGRQFLHLWKVVKLVYNRIVQMQNYGESGLGWINSVVLQKVRLESNLQYANDAKQIRNAFVVSFLNRDFKAYKWE